MAGSRASAGLEESLWLCPIEDRRRLDSSREGMLEGFSLGSYLLLVDYTGRLFRDGKATISRELSGIFDRLGSSAESWWARLEKLSRGRLLGRFFAASRDRLREVATRPGRASPGEPGRMPGEIGQSGAGSRPGSADLSSRPVTSSKDRNRAGHHSVCRALIGRC